MGPKVSVIFVHYSCEFVIAVIIITEFDCSMCSHLKNLQVFPTQKPVNLCHSTDVTTKKAEDFAIKKLFSD